MRLINRLVVLLLLSPLAVTAKAEIYKYYDNDGNLVLSDAVPEEQAEKAEKLPPRQIMTVPAVKPDGRSRAVVASVKPAPRFNDDYTITIQSPSPEATYRRESGEVPVAFSVDPALKDGHQLELLLDGNPATDLASVSAEALDRGSHVLEARIVDEGGKVLQSARATFYIQQSSALGSQNARKDKDASDDKSGKSGKGSGSGKPDKKPASKK